MKANLTHGLLFIWFFTPLLIYLDLFARPLCKVTTAAQVRTGLMTTALAGILLGIGKGCFVDGILFSQIFQFHGMLSHQHFSDTLANEQINRAWDGIFHTITLPLAPTHA